MVINVPQKVSCNPLTCHPLVSVCVPTLSQKEFEDTGADCSSVHPPPPSPDYIHCTTNWNCGPNNAAVTQSTELSAKRTIVECPSSQPSSMPSSQKSDPSCCSLDLYYLLEWKNTWSVSNPPFLSIPYVSYFKENFWEKVTENIPFVPYNRKPILSPCVYIW